MRTCCVAQGTQCSVMAYMGQNLKKRKSHVIDKISGVRIVSEFSKQNRKKKKKTFILETIKQEDNAFKIFCGKLIFFPEVLLQQGYHISNKQKQPGTFSLEGSKQSDEGIN